MRPKNRNEVIFIGQIKIGLFDYEQSYVVGLMNFINGDKDNSLFALAFSSKEGLIRYMDKHSLELMLLPEEAMEDPSIMECLHGVNVLPLLEEDPTPGKLQEGVYKYSRGKDICQYLVQAAKRNEVSVKSDLIETYAVTSPVGRCGKTRVAQAICTMDEVRGGLYVGLEDFGCMEDEPLSHSIAGKDFGQEDLTVGSDPGYTMSDMAYLIKSRSKELIYYVEKAVVNDGPLAMIKTPLSYLDTKELDAADNKKFI